MKKLLVLALALCGANLFAAGSECRSISDPKERSACMTAELEKNRQMLNAMTFKGPAKPASQADAASSVVADDVPFPAPPADLAKDAFLKGYLLDKAAWRKRLDAFAFSKAAAESRNAEDLAILSLEKKIMASLKTYAVKNGDSRDVIDQKTATKYEVAKELWDICQNSNSKLCRLKLPNIELSILAPYAQVQDDFKFFIRDGVKRHKELADQLGSTGSMLELARIYSRFELTDPQGISWKSFDVRNGPYVPEVFDLTTAKDYFRKSIRAGGLDENACSYSIQLMDSNLKLFEADYLRKIGIAKVCKYNYETLKQVDPFYKALSPEGRADLDKHFPELLAFHEKKFTDFKSKVDKFPYVAVVTCTVGNDTSFFRGCFNSKVGTKSAVQVFSSGKVTNFNIMNNFAGEGASAQTSSAFIIDLEKKYKLVAQKAAESPLVLNVTIFDALTGKELQKKSAYDQFQTVILGE